MPSFNSSVGELRELSSRYKTFMVFTRFMKYVTIGDPDDCWEWEGAKRKDGYGWFSWPDKHIQFAHIASYRLFIGPTRGLDVCHKCDNPSCINPFHLWLGTVQQNMRDRTLKGRQNNAKLTTEKVDAIRKMYAKTNLSQSAIAEKFNIHQATVSKVINMGRWKEVRMPCA